MAEILENGKCLFCKDTKLDDYYAFSIKLYGYFHPACLIIYLIAEDTKAVDIKEEYKDSGAIEIWERSYLPKEKTE
jgi:hypothetical protein